MGNVSAKGKRDGLTNFQRRKLKYDFDTFFGKWKKSPRENSAGCFLSF